MIHESQYKFLQVMHAYRPTNAMHTQTDMDLYMRASIHKHIHACIYIYRHAYTYTHTQRIHERIYAPVHLHTYIHKHVYNTYIHTYRHIYIHIDRYARAYIDTCVPKDILVHECIHIHIITCKKRLPDGSLVSEGRADRAEVRPVSKLNWKLHPVK